MTQIADTLAARALALRAIKLQPTDPFTWASGYRMPIYNDNRLFLGDAADRATIANGFSDIINAQSIPFDVIAGTATAGIPHATTLADLLAKPLVYVRSQAKGHGMQNRIEGPLPDGAHVLLVEDLVSTGKSSISAVEALREAGASVTHCVAIFSYGFPAAADAFSQTAVSLHTLLTFPDLLSYATKNSVISDDDRASLAEWSAAPFDWGQSRGFPKVED